jgi:hypothetical protein
MGAFGGVGTAAAWVAEAWVVDATEWVADEVSWTGVLLVAACFAADFTTCLVGTVAAVSAGLLVELALLSGALFVPDILSVVAGAACGSGAV